MDSCENAQRQADAHDEQSWLWVDTCDHGSSTSAANDDYFTATIVVFDDDSEDDNGNASELYSSGNMVDVDTTAPVGRSYTQCQQELEWPPQISDSSGKPEDALWKRLSPLTADGSRCFGCTASELADLRSWLQWQAHDPISIIARPSLIVIGDHGSNLKLPESDYIRCEHALATLLHSRSVEEVLLVLNASYFIGRSFRTLLIPELVAALQTQAMFQGYRNVQLSPLLTESTYSPSILLELSGEILHNDCHGAVTFQQPWMATFLDQVELPGFDHGHGTMTEMCFEQIKSIGTKLIVQPWRSFRKWFGSPHEWPLLHYVSKYWFQHYRLTADLRVDLSSELVTMINVALSDHTPQQTPLHLQRCVIDIGFEISQIYDLPQLGSIYQNMGCKMKPSTKRPGLRISNPCPTTIFKLRHPACRPNEVCPVSKNAGTSRCRSEYTSDCIHHLTTQVEDMALQESDGFVVL